MFQPRMNLYTGIICFVVLLVYASTKLYTVTKQQFGMWLEMCKRQGVARLAYLLRLIVLLKMF